MPTKDFKDSKGNIIGAVYTPEPQKSEASKLTPKNAELYMQGYIDGLKIGQEKAYELIRKLSES